VFVPKVEWEVGGRAAQACNEVFLKRLDGSFDIVATVEACWGELLVRLLRVHVVLQYFEAFVVKALELGVEASFV